ncbi:VOC family protein [Luteimonas suaedae]|uniref:VOC family protein n=1 Tax=Luteimonas suaedae TaxID=2605430 RepID=UPI0011EEFFEC|nr:VOC family protein [Luteimonas suaedae]
MKVQRIVANVETTDVEAADAFYRGVLGLDLVMDHGWLRTYASPSMMSVQVSFASQGGSDTPVPELSIEVDDLAEALRRVKDSGTPIEYGPVSEPWGVRRFYVRDPLGKLVNILQHEPSSAP